MRAARISLLILFTLVAGFQIRSSSETIHQQRNLDYWLPFAIEPFSGRLTSVSEGMYLRAATPLYSEARCSKQLQLLAINGRPFRGMSQYLRLMMGRTPTIGTNGALRFLVRCGQQAPAEAEFLIPHCTCGTASYWQLTQTFVLAPLFCTVLAFIFVWHRPDALSAWSLAILCLALSQLDFFWSPASNFIITPGVMTWGDASRAPAVAYRAFIQSCWPGALVIALADLLEARPTVIQGSRYLGVALLCWSFVQALLAVAWSEDYLPFVPLHNLLQEHITAFRIAGVFAVAVLGLLEHRVLGGVLLANAAVTALLLHRSAAVPTSAAIVMFATFAATCFCLFRLPNLPRTLVVPLLALLMPAIFLQLYKSEVVSLNGPLTWLVLQLMALCTAASVAAICWFSLRCRRSLDRGDLD